MSMARKCDKCGKLYEEYENIEHNDIKVNGMRFVMRYPNNGSFYSREPVYDLCPKCMHDLIQFLESEKKDI